MEIVTEETINDIDTSRDIENLKKVEAALFIAGKFLTEQELVALTDLNPILLSQALAKITEKYDDNSAIEVLNKGDLWKMDVKQEYIDIVNRLATGNTEFTRAEQETLAVIAHKQPITQSKIIHIRGNKAYDHIRKFTELGLVKTKRHGRTYDLSLSDEFYDYFSVKEKSFKKPENKDEIEENKPFNEKVVENNNSHTSDSDESKVSKNIFEKEKKKPLKEK